MIGELVAEEAVEATLANATGEVMPSDVRIGGTTVHVGPTGCIEQPNDTVWLKPPAGIKATSKFNSWPGEIEALVGESLSEKSVGGVAVDIEIFVTKASAQTVGGQFPLGAKEP